MEESFDVCTPDGVPTGQTCPRNEVHRRGLWHRSSHLWLFDGRGRVLLQQRHPAKETDPGRWDIAVAGHLSAGQSPLEAMVREAWEELGLTLDPGSLTFLGALSKEDLTPGFLDREWQHLFAGHWNGDLGTLVLQPDEVVAVRWMGVEDLRHCVEAGDPAFVDRRADSAAALTWDRKHRES
jgi:8-oxo-dGTP pyrophosphatase MutT (NUDIX family)